MVRSKIRRRRLASTPSDGQVTVALSEVDAAIALVLIGGAARVRLTGFAMPTADTLLATAPARDAGVGFMVEPSDVATGSLITVGPLFGRR